MVKKVTFKYPIISIYTMEYTTIKIRKNQKMFLDRLKVHPRQSYEEILDKLISKFKRSIRVAK